MSPVIMVTFQENIHQHNVTDYLGTDHFGPTKH